MVGHLFRAKKVKIAPHLRRKGYLKSNGGGLGMVRHPSIHKMRDFDTKNIQIHTVLSLPGRKYCVAQNEGSGIDWEGQNDKCEMYIHYREYVWCSQLEIWIIPAGWVLKTSMRGGAHSVSCNSLASSHQIALLECNIY